MGISDCFSPDTIKNNLPIKPIIQKLICYPEIKKIKPEAFEVIIPVICLLHKFLWTVGRFE